MHARSFFARSISEKHGAGEDQDVNKPNAVKREQNSGKSADPKEAYGYANREKNHCKCFQ